MSVWLVASILIGVVTHWAIAVGYVCIAAMQEFSETFAADLPAELAQIPIYRALPQERERNRSRIALFRDSIMNGASTQLQLTSDDMNSLLVLSQKLGALIPLHYTIEGDRLIERTGSVIPTLFGPSGYFKQVSSIRFDWMEGQLVEILEMTRTRFSMKGAVIDRQSSTVQKPIQSSTVLRRLFGVAAKLNEHNKSIDVLAHLKQISIQDSCLTLMA